MKEESKAIFRGATNHAAPNKRMWRVIETTCVCACVRLCVRERLYVCVCVCVRERECVCVCVSSCVISKQHNWKTRMKILDSNGNSK
jgi:hypothetical protein